MNKTLISSVVVLVGIQFFEIFFHREAVSHYTKSLIFAYIFLIISVLILLNNKLIAYKEEIMRREKEAQYERLNLYTRQVEQMYQTVRGFKHDYKNMLISLEESIRTGNIDEVRFLFHEILIRANVALSEGENIDDLSYLENPALKSLLYHKLVEATRDGVEVVIEIKQEIRDVKMDLLDFVRLLSVLLDNAIEASKMATRPRLTLAIVQDKGRHIVYVSNSKAEGLVPIHRIYQKDYSTKGSDRGTGLFNVQEIVERFSHVMLETEQTEDTFTQIVYIGG
ncbi:sensor histidine kinase [Streptococcus rifensis]